MANCRKCEHYGKQHMVDGYNDLAWVRWPCSKGVASLPVDMHADRWEWRAVKGIGWVKNHIRQIQKLPWMIDNHECPEFSEVE